MRGLSPQKISGKGTLWDEVHTETNAVVDWLPPCRKRCFQKPWSHYVPLQSLTFTSFLLNTPSSHSQISHSFSLNFSSSIFIVPRNILLRARAGQIYQLNTKKEKLPFYLTLTFSAQRGGLPALKDGSDWEGRRSSSISVRKRVIPPANYSNHVCPFQPWADVIHEKQQEALW